MKRPDVKGDPVIIEAQTCLSALGFPLGATGPHHDGVDGRPGEMTSAALAAFQRCAGLPPTGAPDGATLPALRYAVQSGWTVRELARRAGAPGTPAGLSPAMDRAEFVNAVFLLALPDADRRTGGRHHGPGGSRVELRAGRPARRTRPP